MADFATLRVTSVREALPNLGVWMILLRDIVTGGEQMLFCNATAETELSSLIRISGLHWPIETCSEDGEQLLGMGSYEVRSRIGWHYDMTLYLATHHAIMRLQREFKENSKSDLASGGAAVDSCPPHARMEIQAVLSVLCYRIIHNKAAYESHCRKRLKILAALDEDESTRDPDMSLCH